LGVQAMASCARYLTVCLAVSESSSSSMPRVGERVELARYVVGDCERVLYGQRINGVVRITDRPSGGRGRSYLVERGLERDGYSALKALVADYTQLAQRLGEVPMATSLIRNAIEQEAHEASWLQILLAELARVAPSLSSGPVEKLSLEELQASLTAALSVRALQRIGQLAAVHSGDGGEGSP
jgi:hypothetical protein